jgi:hypothetical protein
MRKIFYKTTGFSKIFVLIFLSFGITSCSLQKRLYRPGVYSEFNKISAKQNSIKTKENFVLNKKNISSYDSAAQNKLLNPLHFTSVNIDSNDILAQLSSKQHQHSYKTHVNIFVNNKVKSAGDPNPLYKKRIKQLTWLAILCSALSLLFTALYYSTYALVALGLALFFLIMVIIYSEKAKAFAPKEINKIDESQSERMNYSKMDKALIMGFVLLVFAILLGFVLLLLELMGGF